MYIKLVARNIRRSIKDYVIYFVTIILSISLIYSFNALGLSNQVLKLADNMSMLTTAISILSWVLVVVIAYLVDYITKFIVKKRKKEFGLYALLGMENKTIASLFLYENLIFGIISLFIGIITGMFFFQIFIYIIMNIFDSTYQYTSEIPTNAIGVTLMYYFFMYLILIFTSSISISKMKIYDLLYSSKKNEQDTFKKNNITFFVFFIFLCLLGIKLIFDAFSYNDNSAYFYIISGIACIIIGIYYSYIYVSSFILAFYKKSKKYRYKNTNIFLVRQIYSKVKTTGKTMGVLSILITIALLCLISGRTFGDAYKVNIKSEAPFDIIVNIDYPNIDDNQIYNFINEHVEIDEYIKYNIYENQKNTTQTFGNSYIKLSVYNKLRHQLGLDEKKLKNHQFILHSDQWDYQKKIKKSLASDSSIKIGNTILTSHHSLLYKEPFAQWGTNGKGCLIVVNDIYFDKLIATKSRIIASTINSAPPKLKNDLFTYVKTSKDILINYDLNTHNFKNITIQVILKTWSYTNGLVGLSALSFGSIYLSFIFIIISMTILALQQLTDSTEHKYRFDLLRKIGVDKNELSKIIFKQIFIYFSLPIILPIIITIIFSFCFNKYFGTYIMQENLILRTSIETFSLFFSIYIIYFIVTYFGFKKNILT